jgi:hypothetical protein
MKNLAVPLVVLVALVILVILVVLVALVVLVVPVALVVLVVLAVLVILVVLVGLAGRGSEVQFEPARPPGHVCLRWVWEEMLASGRRRLPTNASSCRG